MLKDKSSKIVKKDVMKEKFKTSLNEAIAIFNVEKNIQVGILKLDPGTRLPEEGMSKHEENHEFSFVIEGEVIVGTQSGEKKIKKGELMYNEPGTEHYTQNKNDKPAKILWFVSPPIQGLKMNLNL